ncbi:MAG: hypothetical protein GWN18_17910, partial [Thermoplasmata archaeon]|nr:hypothetical protein [Thermoplasmata archaeon]NIS14001.1 hypothetical protein [Thermoplasmata archaeon]NIS21833.1 hypothetical protein [Thermoplasmata archaeon]NIT79438.1 hypothetical protein [Thermoplasmata archaeon]NIU50870.1 hypothetical protein [Thermoplasmata archaeon]
HPAERLTLAVNDLNVSVSGLVLTAYFEDWAETHPVHITLTDGDLTTHANVTLRVVNVNDPPSEPEILSPANGTVFTTGEAITFQVQFQD